MNWYKNLKISTKLIIGFVIVAVIAGVIGVVGIINIHKINISDTELYELNTEPLEWAGIISTDYTLLDVNLRDLLFDTNQKNKETHLNEIESTLAEINDYLILFDDVIETDEENGYYESVKKGIDDFKTVKDELVSLVSNGNTDDAVTFLYDPDTQSILTEVYEPINQLLSLNSADAENKADTNSEEAQNTIVFMIIVLIIGIIIAVSLGVFISRIISKPIKEIVVVANRIADGDLDVNININTKDETGILSKAFEKMAGNLNEAMDNINSASEQVAVGSKQVSDSSIALSQGATEQASSIEELTASLEEISSQTKLNAQNANQANELADNAKSNAMQGNSQMQEMLKAMDEINEASTSISKIIKVIDDIAFQTNILALNAAVEAARAGQHGKGFAVVAEEVRNLAARSANAAKETTDMIESSIKKVEGGTKIAKDTAEALTKIVGGIEKVSFLVNDIAVASNEQASGIGQINQGIIQVSQVVQSNSATSEESAAASEELSSQAGLLKDMVSKFKLRKNSGSYKSKSELSPEILKMLEDMSSRKKDKGNANDTHGSNSSSKPKIILSDKEFGKY